jgi:hypothetical protein
VPRSCWPGRTKLKDSVYVLVAKDHRQEKAKREALENAADEPTTTTTADAGVPA